MQRNTFTITEDHLTLLANACVDENDAETGAPCIDPKRPYGNSNVAGDIFRILNWDTEHLEYGTSEYRDAADDALAIHHELIYVVQILFQHATQGIKDGDTFQRKSDQWKRMNK